MRFVNDRGEVLDEDGMVMGIIYEGTEYYPALPRYHNNVIAKSGVSETYRRIMLIKRAFMPVEGVRDIEDLVKNWVNEFKLVLGRAGIPYSEEQVVALATSLRGRWPVKRPTPYEVLECVLDPGCIKYSPGLRRLIEDKFNEVFGSLISVHINRVLREWGLEGAINVNEVLNKYADIIRITKFRKRHFYRRTLIELAITAVLLDNLDRKDVEDILRGLGKEELIKIIDALYGSQ
ncbi:hypothetical protein [Vulcanisaeta distributa]|uniref:Uncharacterized protein n=1 Tax=Vulcanisaeta distributa (strain DSM 14429 / JCM 11212 / NBRC 100878 / IC-017) TaxID=572478 RepID=E1QQL9_VULDI|nr:hypothetical protein [Vulcanisaeta distributa]ADN51631.1 hypothetical protein Vdis_2263 [Vulcanisaeta distributa DSM 14429]